MTPIQGFTEEEIQYYIRTCSKDFIDYTQKRGEQNQKTIEEYT